MARSCFVLNHIGDYHAARLSHCAGKLNAAGSSLFAIQASAASAFYHHTQSRSQSLLTTFDNICLGSGTQRWSIRQLWRALRRAAPTHIFTIGYSDRLSLVTLAYAKVHGARVFFMADSKADDQDRSALSERLKGYVIRLFDGALVAGERHREYFRSLGSRAPIEIGYDVIDNEFFRKRAGKLSAKVPLMRRRGLLPARYVLCVSRLVDRKRLDLVLKIFSDSGAPQSEVSLVLVGAGPQDTQLHDLIRSMGLSDRVLHFRNVRNTMMGAFYSNAEALILASDYDQWGLCVNEAMSLGVPCLVTDRCGVAGEIVIDDQTGFIFPWGTTEKASADLRRLLAEPDLRRSISAAARDILDDWGLDRFSSGVAHLIGLNGTHAAL